MVKSEMEDTPSRKKMDVAKSIEYSAGDIEDFIVSMRKQGNTCAGIGQLLRDQYGIFDVKKVCKKTVMQIVEEKTGKIEYPEDIFTMIRKAVGLRKHLASHRGDVHNRVQLQDLESKIRRLGKYYRRIGRLPKGWTYDPVKAALLVK